MKCDMNTENKKTNRNAKTSWAIRKKNDISYNCKQCKKLLKVIEEQNLIINKIKNEKEKLEVKLKGTLKDSIKLNKNLSLKNNYSNFSMNKYSDKY